MACYAENKVQAPVCDLKGCNFLPRQISEAFSILTSLTLSWKHFDLRIIRFAGELCFMNQVLELAGMLVLKLAGFSGYVVLGEKFPPL